MKQLLDNILVSDKFASFVFCLIVLICIYTTLRYLTIWGEKNIPYDTELWPEEKSLKVPPPIDKDPVVYPLDKFDHTASRQDDHIRVPRAHVRGNLARKTPTDAIDLGDLL